MTELERVAKATTTTSSVTYGLLNDYQAEKFLKQIFDETPLQKAIRHEIRREKSGEIDKIGIGSRLLRAKVENTANAKISEPTFGVVEYATTPVRLDWEITEETIRQNIEGEGFESTVAGLMANQLAVDMDDLLINGDTSVGTAAAFDATTAYAAGDKVTYDGGLYVFTAAHSAGAWTGTDVQLLGAADDIGFLKVNDGVRKLITNGGHVVDLKSAQSMSLDMFFKGVAAVPNKYNRGDLRWLISPGRAQQWSLYLLNSIIGKGGAVPDGMFNKPAGIEMMQIPGLDDGTIILSDPKNFVQVNTYTMKIRKDAASKDAIQQDKRFYVTHLDYDVIVEELDATAILTNIPSFI